MLASADEIFQIAFFVVLLLGWIVKAIAEQRQERKRREKGPAAEDDEPEAEMPAPSDLPRPPLRRPPPVPPRPLGPAARPGAAGPAAARPRLATRPSAAAPSGGTAQARQRSRAYLLRRLAGGGDARPGRQLTRAGVLWSEVLAFPRALTGPHRTPTVRRRPRS